LYAPLFSNINMTPLQSQVSADFSGRQNAQAAAARIFSVFDGPEDGGSVDATSSDKSSLSHPLKGEIEFEDVKFAYPTRPGHPIFYLNSEGRKGLNLKIPAKKSLGFVGKSGSGKSTVLQLLLRFYDRSDGMIRVDQEQDLNNVNVAWLRGQIGYVGQQPTLFRGTVRENITLGMTTPPSEEEIYLAAKSAHADEFITRLSNGYDTNIGPGGDMLSGGQKQRIAIARAILRRPAMLVLDEATAALDNESEKIVQAALDEIQEREPRTTLVVAHRLQTVKNCDEIVFLGDGGVEESGTHSELLEKDGQYAKLWKMQSAEEALTKKNEY
jgi:ATP-binding cassette subfamily B (MDR/TAP) protein 1